MKRSCLTVLAAVAVASAISACAGSTEPATNILNHSAQLNAKGFANDGPATWWWEISDVKADLGTGRDGEVCGSGVLIKEEDARCGPATGGSSSAQIPLNVVVTGLRPNTTYYFRACGQDTNDPEPTCANTRSFTTLLGANFVPDRNWGTLNTPGAANGQFNAPQGVATDYEDGSVYVADTGNNRIQKFNAAGNFVAKWNVGAGPSEPTEPQQLNGPTDIEPRDVLYIADAGNDRIVTTTKSGQYISNFGTRGTAPGQFAKPSALTYRHPFGLLVADEQNNRIQQVDPATGSGQVWIGSAGDNDGEFRTPTGITVGGFGVLLVSEGGTQTAGLYKARVQAFNPVQVFLWKWTIQEQGVPHALSDVSADVFSDPANDIWTVDQGRGHVIHTDLQGNNPVQIYDDVRPGGPYGAATDLYGYLYIVDRNRHQLRRFKPTQ